MSNTVFAILGIATLVVLGIACGRGSPPPETTQSWDDPLQPGITWTLKTLNGKPVIDGTLITLSEDLASGNDGCNNYGMVSRRDDPPHVIARITQSDGSSAEGEFSARIAFVTRLGCEGRHEEQADAYQTALKEGERFRIKGDWLEISDGRNQSTLVFARQPPFPGHQPALTGTQWRMMGNENPVTLAFLDDELAAIAGECWDFIWRYRTIGRLFEFHEVHSWNLHQICLEGDSSHSLWEAEQYSVIEEEASEKLMIGTSLGKTLTLDALPAVTLDAGQGEWSLKNIMDLSSDDVGHHVIRGIVPGSTVTVKFQETSASGSAGCNSYQTSLRIDGEAIDIGPVSKSAASCRHLENFNAVIRQEVRYLELLSQVTRGVTVADRLFLSTGTGIYLIFEAE